MKSPKRTDHPEDAGACYASAMRLLNVRWHARRELERKLALRGYAPSAIDETTERLAREGWIDDRRFADEYVRSRLQRRVAKRRIELELERLGVDGGIVREAVTEGFDEETERQQIMALARRKADEIVARSGIESLHAEVGRRKLSQALFRRGYDGSDVIDAVERILHERPNEDEND